MTVPVTSKNTATWVENNLQPLLDRTLILTAHPDDELACAAIIQRMRHPILVIATDGAPLNRYFWASYGVRQNYAVVRRHEAEKSVARAGVKSLIFLNHRTHGSFTDQLLHTEAMSAVAAVEEIVRETSPSAILTPAYEGGHPDHDTCSFIAAATAKVFGLPVWEMPLYHRDAEGQLRCHEFLDIRGNEEIVTATRSELIQREQMFDAYRSQSDLRMFVHPDRECYRPQPVYDYSRPPHRGSLNYEVWRWPMTGADVCLSLSNCQRYIETAGVFRTERPKVNEAVSGM